jgi:signal transduction histidine kinase
VAQIAGEAAEQGRRAAADELVTVLAHDLRNFLAPIETRLALLRQRAVRDERGADVRDAERAQTMMRRLSGIIADLLDVARIDEGLFMVELQPTDLRPLLDDIAATLGAPEHPVLIETERTDDTPVLADPTRLRQCLENLVANAVKHSPAGAPVRLVLAAGSNGACVRVDVIDRGAGIAHDMLGRIFERYVTGERREGGLGLGLYLAKRIAVLHGGDLTVESAPGEGTRFSLTLRCPAAAH